MLLDLLVLLTQVVPSSFCTGIELNCQHQAFQEGQVGLESRLYPWTLLLLEVLVVLVVQEGPSVH